MSVLNTSVSGMLADSNWLSNIAQNVANANTTGYKNTETEFSALVDSAPGQTPQVAGVSSTTTSYNTMQGQLTSTQTTTDLAVQGAGFFLVSDGSGDIFLTRNGSFTPDSQGDLVNSAGYYLMAQPTTTATAATTSVNSVSGLTKVNVDGSAAAASPSTTASLTANLDSTASTVAAANLPSTNTSSSAYTSETTMTAYDSLGGAHTVNLYFTNEGGGVWEVDAYDSSTAASGGGFSYSSAALATGTLNFDTTTGALTSGSPLSIPIPGGDSVSLNLDNTTQLATSFGVSASTINGNAPGTVDGVSISTTGILSFNYTNGASQDAYVIPLANVASPDNLTSVLGDAFQTNFASGSMQITNADTGGLGAINSSSLESSTVDLATELTTMIQAQSAYQANSKVFQTGADIFDILNNLKS
jgi:flagellar hook protein FlgE